MKTIPTCVNGCLVYQLDRHYDNRGYFEEIFNYEKQPKFSCHQVNLSYSEKNVLRGLHAGGFAKFVRCVKGMIFDVVADIRSESVSYKKWYGQILTQENALSIYVPPYCAHGFVALEDSIVVYSQDGYYDPINEHTLSYADPVLQIIWPVKDKDLILSEKDLNAKFWTWVQK